MRGVTIVTAALRAIAGSPVADRVDAIAAPHTAVCPVICGDDTPVWSPDGRTIAFFHYVRGASGPRATVAAVAAGGGPLRSVVGLASLYPNGNGPLGPFGQISWSPDSATIAFAGWRGGGWTVPAAGGPLHHTSTYLPVWSPDGRRLAIEAPHDLGGWRYPAYVPAEIRVASADGSSAHVVAGTGLAVPGGRWAANPVWSVNDEIAYVTGDRLSGGWANLATSEVWSVRPDGSGARPLVVAGLHGSEQGYRLLGWSRDGAQLFFGVVVNGLSELVAVDRAGGTPRLVYATGASDTACCWLSPDATRVALYRASPDERFGLYVVDLPRGTEKRVVAGVTGRTAASVSWSPAGNRLAFASGDECGPLFGVETVAVDGSHRTRLTSSCRTNGGPGRDILRGGGGPDALYGRGAGNELGGGGGPDFLQGGSGDDVVRGGAGDDRVHGGPGRDRLFGDGGADTIEAREGAADEVRCRTGVDHVRVDRKDTVGLDCEFVERR